MQLATSQPCINYSCGHINGYNIEDNTRLTIGKLNTHPLAKLDLFHRPYSTVPYLGRGSVDPTMEAQILMGEAGPQRIKTHNPTTEKMLFNNTYVPLIPELAQNIQNTNYLIEADASEGTWQRGGIPSRELTKDRR